MFWVKLNVTLNKIITNFLSGLSKLKDCYKPFGDVEYYINGQYPASFYSILFYFVSEDNQEYNNPNLALKLTQLDEGVR